MTINGGTLVVNASGDGLDSNGSIEMNDGTVVVNGPTDSMNGTLDYDSTFNMNGGPLIGAGSSGMAMSPSSTSVQSFLFTSSLPLAADHPPWRYAPQLKQAADKWAAWAATQCPYPVHPLNKHT